MPEATLHSLIVAARRRVWQGEFAAAARRASWGTIAVTLLAIVVHLALRPIGAGAVVVALAVVWAAMIALAGLRRPSDAACALWADRHAGGASAYSTWLEMRSAGPATGQAPAFAWLERWASAKVPESLRLLEGRRDPLRLARPLVAVTVCAALAAIVLSLPGFAPSTRPAGPTSPNVVERATPEAAPSVASELVGDLANALRAGESHRTDGRSVDSSPAAEPRLANTTTELTPATAGAAAPGERATAGPPSGSADATAPAGGAAAASSAGSGRGAGDSADRRADAGSSRAARGTMPLQSREPTTPFPSPSLRADMTQPAAFDEDVPAPKSAGVRADRPPPAAPPPATTETAELTATQAAYVRAWMKATASRH